jgi:hypothetical protein
MEAAAETWRIDKPRHYSGVEGSALQPRLVRAIEPYARCHLACVEVTPSIGNAILPPLLRTEMTKEEALDLQTVVDEILVLAAEKRSEIGGAVNWGDPARASTSARLMEIDGFHLPARLSPHTRRRNTNQGAPLHATPPGTFCHECLLATLHLSGRFCIHRTA